MASRVTRSALLALAGVGIVSALLLPPGHSALHSAVSAGGRTPPSPLDDALAGNEHDLRMARRALEREVVTRAMTPLLMRSGSPTAVVVGDGRVVFEPRYTAAAEAIWREFPARAGAPRTVLVLLAGPEGQIDWPAPSPEVCYDVVGFRPGPIGGTLRRVAGRCALITRFGLPGASLRSWLDSVAAFPIPRGMHALREAPSFRSPPVAGWFGMVDEAPWWLSLPLQACVGGRRAQCVAGLGFGPEGPGRSRMGGWYYRNGTPVGVRATVLEALLADMGPEAFGELWRGDAPVPEAYARLTGRQFDLWAERYVVSLAGRRITDQGLSLAGWWGWVVWMVLLSAWLAVRLRARPAS